MNALIVDNYDSFTFNLYQMFQEQFPGEVKVIRNDEIDIEGIKRLRSSAIILSPGPGHPATPADFGVCREIVINAAALGCPILGVCLGHQGIAHYLGGTVGRAPQVMHGKTSRVKVTAQTRLLSGMEEFEAMRYHSLTVNENSLPDCLTITAREVERATVMALEHKSLPVYGVQFHPESIGTPEGKRIIRNFTALCKLN